MTGVEMAELPWRAPCRTFNPLPEDAIRFYWGRIPWPQPA